jgi:hypothetical protein
MQTRKIVLFIMHITEIHKWEMILNNRISKLGQLNSSEYYSVLKILDPLEEQNAITKTILF